MIFFHPLLFLFSVSIYLIRIFGLSTCFTGVEQLCFKENNGVFVWGIADSWIKSENSLVRQLNYVSSWMPHLNEIELRWSIFMKEQQGSEAISGGWRGPSRHLLSVLGVGDAIPWPFQGVSGPLTFTLTLSYKR